MGIKAWELEDAPFWWVRRYQVYLAGQGKAQQMQQRKGAK